MKLNKVRFLGFLLCFGVVSWTFCEGHPVDTLEGLVRQLIGLQREKVALENEWKAQRVMLQAETDLLGAEKGDLMKELAAESKALAGVDSEVRVQLAERGAVDAKLSATAETLQVYENRLVMLFPRLPEILQVKLKGSLMKLKHGGKKLADRLRLLVAVLEEIEVFDTRIHVGYVVLRCPDKVERSMQVMYLGLGAAFAVSERSNGSFFAARGRPTRVGWSWAWDDSIGLEIKHAIAIYQKDQNAQLVKLPLEVSR